MRGPQFAVTLSMVIFICLCTVFDVSSLAYLGRNLGANQPLANIPLDKLPFLSSYSHLDDLYQDEEFKAAPRGPTTQRPYSLTQVNSSAPEDTQLPYPEQFKSMSSGMIPYNERRTIVTPEVSMQRKMLCSPC